MKNYNIENSDQPRVNKKILTEIIKLFVIKEKQTRFLEFIESPKRYNDFVGELLRDPRNLKFELITEVPNNQQEFKEIAAKLKELGAKDKAYFVSNNYEDDGKIGKLEEILSLICDEGFVYCLDTNLAYYEGHESWRYILCAK
jgi:hypothetical protein